jgi:hypothetical protein
MSFAFEKGDDDVMLKPPRRAVVPKDVYLEPSEVRDMERTTHIEVRFVCACNYSFFCRVQIHLTGYLCRL